jgi:hypothetical protein
MRLLRKIATSGIANAHFRYAWVFWRRFALRTDEGNLSAARADARLIGESTWGGHYFGITGGRWARLDGTSTHQYLLKTSIFKCSSVAHYYAGDSPR